MRTLLDERVAEKGLEAGGLLLSGSGHLADREGCQRLIEGQRMDCAEGRKEREGVLRDEGFACRSFPPERDRSMFEGGKADMDASLTPFSGGGARSKRAERRGLTVLCWVRRRCG